MKEKVTGVYFTDDFYNYLMKLEAEENCNNLLRVYMHIVITMRRQNTNRAWATSAYIAKGIRIGVNAVKRAKQILRKYNLISYHKQKQGGKTYTEVHHNISSDPSNVEGYTKVDVRDPDVGTGTDPLHFGSGTGTDPCLLYKLIQERIGSRTDPCPEMLKDIYIKMLKVKNNGQASKKSVDSSFSAFWEKYPRKVGKQDAKKAYEAKVKAGVPPAALLRAVENFSAEMKSEGREMKYIMHARRFLAAALYEDYLDKVNPAGPDVQLVICPSCKTNFELTGDPVYRPTKRCPNCGLMVKDFRKENYD